MAQAKVDSRNLEWKDNNVGSKLLQKMGWKDGQGIGKRRLLKSESDVSSEGLRVRRRADGLGLGASSQAASQSSTSPVADFADVLNKLQEEHGAKRKKKTSKSGIVAMPTNKSTHARVRKAKFQAKSADDMKCIFAGADVFAAAAASTSTESDKKRKRDAGEKEKKRKKKKDKKERKSKKSEKKEYSSLQI